VIDVSVDGDAVPLGMPSLGNEHALSGHRSVLETEAVDALLPRLGGTYVDGTFGAGGHARQIARRIHPGGRLICIDRDPATRMYFDQLAATTTIHAEFITGSYAQLPSYLVARGIAGVDGILLDLGLSSLQLDAAERGFSIRGEGPLDMRFDPTSGTTAADLLATAPEQELRRILWTYGEERQARRIARAIVRERERQPIETTTQLAALVERVVGGRRGARIHPATRTFQALRIAVNDELGEVERGIAAGIDALLQGGRFVVIAFHSLEDRIVKQAFAAAARGCICPRDVPVCICGQRERVRLVGRAVRPSDAEVSSNPRARSAVLRVAERLAAP
jgi:16S rRNA (cytosine1402-N4)-methyltransferase